MYALIAYSCLLIAAAAWELPGTYGVFKTEPDFLPSLINVSHVAEDRSLLEPGYHFIAPHIGMKGYGPQIIDDNGDLIWYGNPTVTTIQGISVYAMNFYVCDFMGEKMNHLCFSEARPPGGEDEGIKEGGANRILNNAYEPVVDDFASMGNLTHPNPHEFYVAPGGDTFVQAVYPKKSMDLRPYEGRKDGWVWDGCIQDIDLHTRSVIFQWCALDHLPIWETYLYLNNTKNTANISSSTSGKGTFGNPWDFMHLNAVDKNSEGDYLISSRHLSQILKVAGPDSASGLTPGTIIWRLNGKHSDFEMQEDARFARQHHSRYISTSTNETLISLFNNAFNNSETKTDRSNAMILRLNNYTMKATLEHIYQQPNPKLSYAQGSMSVLAGERGNVHVGWGTYPEWSEFSQNGTLLYHARTYADTSKINKKLTNYRAFKFPWVGRPHYNPKLVAYRKTCHSPLSVYVSWNGATEVGAWRVYLSRTLTGPRILGQTFDKEGFETKIRLSLNDYPDNFVRWVTVEALEKNNESVLSVVTSKVFVPSLDIAPSCSEDGCFTGKVFHYSERYSKSCGSKGYSEDVTTSVREPARTYLIPAILLLAVIVFLIELLDSMVSKTLERMTRRRTSRYRIYEKVKSRGLY